MISQPRITVLGMSKLYVSIEQDDSLLVVVVLGFEPYVRFELRFKPSAYLYLRTSSKTRIAILVFFKSLLAFLSISYHSSCQEALSVTLTRRVKYLRVLYLCQEVS